MKKFSPLITCFAVTLLTLSGVAASSAGVVPGDTFSFDLGAYNSPAGDVNFALTSSYTAVFGATTTFPGAGPNGQNLTVSSSETFSGLNTTDFFSLSTPANFLTTASYFGVPVYGLAFNIGTSETGGNTVALTLPIASYTDFETVTYSQGTISGAAQATTLSADKRSLSAFPNVDTVPDTISQYGIRTITYSVTYTNVVPEPSAYVFLTGGALLLGWIIVRRRQQAATA